MYYYYISLNSLKNISKNITGVFRYILFFLICKIKKDKKNNLLFIYKIITLKNEKKINLRKKLKIIFIFLFLKIDFEKLFLKINFKNI